MRNFLICGAMAAALTAPAFAQEAEPFTIAGNIALATDYTFRGLSQTDSKPAVQGGFDAAFGSFYVGTWASNVDFGFGDTIEVDLYGGYKFAAGPVTLDIGAIGYLYPGAADDGASQGTGELDYFEGYLKASIAPAEGLSLGAAAYFSPDFTAETGEAYYIEANGGYTITDALAVSGAVGYQSIDDIDGIFSGTDSAEYMTWNIGGTYSFAGVGLDLRYVGTDVDGNDPIVSSAFTTEQKADDRIIFTIKKAL